METCKYKRYFPRWATNLLIWCCPALVLLLAFVCILSLIPDRDTVVTLVPVLFVGLIVTRLIFLFRSHRTVGAKIWRAAVWTVLLFVQLCLIPFLPLKAYRVTEKDAQSKFEASVAEALPDALPSPLELGSPESVVLHKYLFSNILFTQKADTLLCKYDAADYETEKAALEARYRFRTEPLESGYVGAQLASYVRIGEDSFRFLFPEDGNDSEFYKRSFLVVTNDAEHEIGYILFGDFDLDCTRSLTEFINEDCGWKYIR